MKSLRQPADVSGSYIYSAAASAAPVDKIYGAGYTALTQALRFLRKTRDSCGSDDQIEVNT
jgi:hypothetical protein